jgi:hypothetical protein
VKLIMADFFNSPIDYVLFFYGLAFILLVPIGHLLNRRASGLLAWAWLGLFGAARGLKERLGLLTLGWGSYTPFSLGRLVLATTHSILRNHHGHIAVESQL